MLYVSETTGEHDVSGLSNFTQVLRAKDDDWQDWASHRLANPTSERKRSFACAHAQRARLQLNDTENAIFAISEVELYGYPVATYGMCQDRCRLNPLIRPPRKCFYRRLAVCMDMQPFPSSLTQSSRHDNRS